MLRNAMIRWYSGIHAAISGENSCKLTQGLAHDLKLPFHTGAQEIVFHVVAKAFPMEETLHA